MRIGLRDPLGDFRWRFLYPRYDARCTGFNAMSPHLDLFAPNRPGSDRALYYRLIQSFQTLRTADSDRAADVYAAMLYWKHYSDRFQRARIAEYRDDARRHLHAVISDLPQHLDKHPAAVLELVRRPGLSRISGMKSDTALPARTTFMHFFFPDTVPVFDNNVLHAVGVETEGANKNEDMFATYLPHVWKLAYLYRAECSPFFRETPTRIIDMALWVDRGIAMTPYPGEGLSWNPCSMRSA